MEKLVANLSAKVQKKVLLGRSYFVAPVSLIVEGVFIGNIGPVFYPEDEISRSVSGWNHKPITVGHPKDAAGNYVSGCNPTALEDYAVGMILNASWNRKSKKLRAEAWFEASRLDMVPGGKEIKDALEKGEPVEVSTGLFVDNEHTSGIWHGKEFAGKARNFRPDHLAIILNGVGACSIKDGAGLLVNKTPSDPNLESANSSDKLLESRIQDIRDVSKPLVTNQKVDMDRETLLKALGDEHKEFVANMSNAQVEALAKLEIEKIVEKEVIKEVPVVNQATNLEDVLALAPEAVRSQIQEAFAVNADYRKGLIEKITANPQNQFSVEELGQMPSATLVKLSAFAVNVASAPGKPPVFAGSAPADTTPAKQAGFLPPSTFSAKG